MSRSLGMTSSGGEQACLRVGLPRLLSMYFFSYQNKRQRVNPFFYLHMFHFMKRPKTVEVGHLTRPLRNGQLPLPLLHVLQASDASLRNPTTSTQPVHHCPHLQQPVLSNLLIRHRGIVVARLYRWGRQSATPAHVEILRG